MAVPVIDSMATLVGEDPRTLDDDELKDHLRALVRARSQLDVAMLAAIVEFEQRNLSVSDGQLDTRAWLAHHTGTARKIAGATVWLAKRVRYMPAFAAAMVEGTITEQHSRVYAAAAVEMARRSSAATDEGRGPRKPQLVVVVDVPALNGDPTGIAELEDGTPIPQPLLSQWLCDCSLARVVLAGRSLVLDAGHLVYTPSPAQRRALIARDRGCIVPGCRRKARWCQAHHVTHWPEGPTNLENLTNR
jgi:hypothetical protein